MAARWDSGFERESHEAVGRSVGLSADELAALRDEDLSAFAGSEALAGRVVVALLDGDLDDRLWSTAGSELGVEVIVELTTLVGYYATLALQLRVFRIAD